MPPFSDLQLRDAHNELGGSFFAYDLDAMHAHLAHLRLGEFRLWYACKANPLSSVLQTIRAAGLSCDVASAGELAQALRSGIPAEQILLTGPAKSELFLRQALQAGVRTVVAESLMQLGCLQALALELQTELDVLLRLQLSWEGEGTSMSVLGGAEATVFGLPAEGWGTLPRYSHLRYCGVHVFQWGNVLAVPTLEKIWQQIAVEARAFAQAQGFPLDILDLGGGLGISYQEPSVRIDWQAVESLAPRVRELSGARKLWLELGRYAVGPFGTYVTEVVERKQVRGQEFLVCAGGIQHLARPALVGEGFPVRRLGKRQEKFAQFAVHGPLCTALDRLGVYELPADTDTGDLLAFSQTGAYGFTESMPFFLCHELPGEIILRAGEVSVVRPVEPASAWLR